MYHKLMVGLHSVEINGLIWRSPTFWLQVASHDVYIIHRGHHLQIDRPGGKVFITCVGAASSGKVRIIVAVNCPQSSINAHSAALPRRVCWAPCSRLEYDASIFSLLIHKSVLISESNCCDILGIIKYQLQSMPCWYHDVKFGERWYRYCNLHSSIKIVSTHLTLCTMLLVSYADTHHSLTTAGDPDKNDYYIKSEYGLSGSHCCMKEKKHAE